MDNLPIPIQTLQEIDLHRAVSLAAFKDALEDIESAVSNAYTALNTTEDTVGGTGVCLRLAESRHGGVRPGDLTLEGFRRSLDYAIWNYLLTTSQLTKVMSCGAKDDFYELLKREVPEATLANMRATLLKAIGNSSEYFTESIVEAFKCLPPSYKTNDTAKFTRKVIYEDAASHPFFCIYTMSRFARMIYQLEKAMMIMDSDSDKVSTQCVAIARLNEKVKPGCGFPCLAETPYFKMKLFKKGSVHITFKREDLLDRLNAELARHYGSSALPRKHAKRGRV